MESISMRLHRYIEERMVHKAHAREVEARTRAVLIDPFLRDVLDYDPGFPTHVVVENRADVRRGGTGRKADYALMHDDQAVVLIEAKPADEEPTGASEQLSGYLHATRSARFGICTNGLRYHFYKLDGADRRFMEPQSFFEVDLERGDVASDSEVADLLSMFVRGQFNPERIETWANERKLREPIRSKVRDLLTDPPNALVKVVMDGVDPNVGRGQVGRFRPIVQEVTREFLERARTPVSPATTIASGHASTTSSSSASPQDEQIVSLREQGLSFTAIGERVGLPHYAVRNALIRLGKHVNTPRMQEGNTPTQGEPSAAGIRAAQIGGGEISILFPHQRTEYQATLQPDGGVRLNDNSVHTPSGAIKKLTGLPRNGWDVWEYRDEQSGERRSIGSLPNAADLREKSKQYRGGRS